MAWPENIGRARDEVPKRPAPAAEAAPPPLALRSLTGPASGDIIPLERGALVIGRQSGADLVLADEFVSLRHARLAFEGGALVVEDLGSTNGTYVNGARVKRGCVAEGDRILVGGSILKVVTRDSPPVACAGRECAAATAEPYGPRVMQGRLEEVALPDLLQLLVAAGKGGILTIRRDGHAAELHLENGCVLRCAIDGRDGVPVQKSFYRLLAWRTGHFDLCRGPASSGGSPRGQPVGALLMEGIYQLGELERLRSELPSRFAICAVQEEGLEAEDRALLALVAQDRSLEEVLDATPLSDLEAARRLVALLARGALVGDLGAG